MSSTLDKFYIFYVMFIAFLFLVVGLGGGDILEDIANLDNPALIFKPITQVESMGNPIFDIIIGSLNFMNNILFFFNLMLVDSSVFWLGTIVFTPAFMILFYLVLKLMRGTG